MTDAAQIAFAFLAYIGQHHQGRAKSDLGLDQGVHNRQQSCNAGRVVAGAGSSEAGGTVGAAQRGLERGIGGKNCVEMRGKHDHRAAAFRGKFGGGQKSEHIADGVGLDIGQPCLFEAGGDPFRSCLFAKRRSGNRHQICLPVHDGLRVVVHPRKSGMNGSPGGQRGHPGECRFAGKDRHTLVLG